MTCTILVHHSLCTSLLHHILQARWPLPGLRQVVHLGVRQLLPDPADDVDLVTAYAFPSGRRWVRANMVASVDGAGALDGTTKPLVQPGGPAGVLGAPPARRRRSWSAPGPSGPSGMARSRSGPSTSSAGVRPDRARRRSWPWCRRSLDLDPASDLFVGAPTRTIVITCAAAPADRRRALAAVADVIDAGARRGRSRRRRRCAARARAGRGSPARAARACSASSSPLTGSTSSASRSHPILVGGAPPRLLAG